jgi:ribosome-associated protein
VKSVEFTLETEFVALCDLLKLVGLAGSSGQGKHLVAAGEVMVDGRAESRKTAKIRAGQTVECFDMRINVVGPH